MGSRLGPAPRALIVAFAATLAAGPVVAEPVAPATAAKARALFEQGIARFGARDFEDAIAAFEASYKLDPRPEVLFSLAQAERQSGDCPTAVALYRKFLATDPPARHADAARDGIGKCERALASRPLDVAAPEPAAPEQASAPGPTPVPAPPPTSSPAPRAAWRTPVGLALLGGGALGLGGGAALFVAARKAAGEADDAARYDDYVARMDRAESRQRLAFIVGGAGAALVATGAIVLLTGGGGDDDERPPVAAGLDVGPGAFAVTAAGRF
jgi:tetratricopeptide (TPR) repeat protein